MKKLFFLIALSVLSLSISAQQNQKLPKNNNKKNNAQSTNVSNVPAQGTRLNFNGSAQNTPVQGRQPGNVQTANTRYNPNQGGASQANMKYTPNNGTTQNNNLQNVQTANMHYSPDQNGAIPVNMKYTPNNGTAQNNNLQNVQTVNMQYNPNQNGVAPVNMKYTPNNGTAQNNNLQNVQTVNTQYTPAQNTVSPVNTKYVPEELKGIGALVETNPYNVYTQDVFDKSYFVVREFDFEIIKAVIKDEALGPVEEVAELNDATKFAFYAYKVYDGVTVVYHILTPQK